ncbi:hypothetical protein [Arthrobacter tumbae]|uniref:hypothetical protein n=1 Tax=Arthrobacter tumbae TaxID=163874 RepID=UPI00195DDADF|nr:hypothetical protein [Arthrobacter tumbae]MBM7782534.1 putative membrane protein YhhN [Arthrobacter tumbae]
MKVRPRRAKIALVAGFGAIVVAGRLFAFFVDEQGTAGTVASVAVVVMLVAGVISLYIGFRSLNWNKLRSRLRKRRQR